MKCVQSKLGGRVDRVPDDVAEEMVNSGKVKYVPKHVYKERQKNTE